MTRAIRGNHLKDDRSAISNHFRDDNSSISDHLRNHVHLTNCIHLKNHMHRHSPILAERSLMRDLIVLQRSRSLRDPSTSPPSWHSPSIVGTLSKKAGKSGVVHSGRRSLGIDRRRETGQLSTSSPQVPSVATSKVAAAEAVSDHDSGGRVKGAEISKGEDSAGKNCKSNLSGSSEHPHKELVSRKADARDKKISQKGTHTQNARLRSLSEQLEEVPSQMEVESKNKPSHFCQHRRRIGEESICEEPEASGHGQCNRLSRVKKRRFKGVKARGSIDSADIGVRNDLSIASNSYTQGSMHQKSYRGEGKEEDAELEVTHGPRNGCGIPWNWSRIHHRGRTFLDIAGRSLSCGLSDSRLRKDEGPLPRSQGDNSNMPITSDNLSSSTNSDSEALPLLVAPSGSQESAANLFLPEDYSGELGIFANHCLRHDQDSDLVSEARSGNRHRSSVSHHGRHRSLTQKYMPKTFKDLVGQNLVVQALSNAVLRRKVGLIYVFYGPRGTGKTSCARVFAKALNCQSVDHPKPCDVCPSCISHNLGKTRNVLEVGPVDNYDFEGIMDVLDNMISPLSSQYRVFIVDDCDILSPDSWSAISKIIDRAPRHVVFVLISTNLEHLPHIIISRCQKFFFPKVKDSDIIYQLQWIASSEGLEIDKDALKLIASRSDGSLRDAEMTLDQLSLLGQRISLRLVQELVGLVSDEKLVDLLDLALSADTVNTVKALREIMEAGVEPLALMSQLATIITDILAGSYVFTRERLRRKFFRRLTLSKEDMEKLRRALRTLSEAEKQLRLSNDRLTWLTAALLQLAPDQQYMLPSSSTGTSFNHSPMVLNNISERDIHRDTNNEQSEVRNTERGLSRGNELENLITGSASYYISGKKHVGQTPQTFIPSTEVTKAGGMHNRSKGHKESEKIWHAVLEKIQSDALKQFMYQEGKLISVILGSVPTVQLMFSSNVSKSKAEKFRGYILQAFESVLRSSIILEIRCESRKDVRSDVQIPLGLPASENGSSQRTMRQKSVSNQRAVGSGSETCIRKCAKDNVATRIGSTRGRCLHSDPGEMATSEIIETVASPQKHEHIELTDNLVELEEKGLENVWAETVSSSHHQATLIPLSERRENGEQPRRQSLVRSKVSLAHVIQQAEGCAQRGGWSRRKAISIAEKLEQENLRLEPRSRSLLCWRASRITRGKLPHLRIRTRKPCSLFKLVTCGRCLCARSPSSARLELRRGSPQGGGGLEELAKCSGETGLYTYDPDSPHYNNF